MVDLVNTFVCGWPIEHSRSPIIHNYWIKRYGLRGKYEKLPVSPDDLTEFINCLPEGIYLGGNVTIPHKEKAYELIENLDPVAKKLGAVNTIWVSNQKIYGANTDGYGFLANLDQGVPDWDNENRKFQPVVILGAGGAARAIVDAAQSRGFSNIKIVNRTLSRAENLAIFFGEGVSAHCWEELPNLMEATGLIVNTTSLGMAGNHPLDIDLNILTKDCLVSDIVYVPLQTKFLQQAAERGLKTVDGLGMLLHQAVPGFEKWYGVKPEVSDELRALVISDLKETK